MKKVFLKISKSSQENACARVSFLIKLQAHLFFIIHIRWLLLVIVIFTVYESEAFNNSLQNLTAYLLVLFNSSHGNHFIVEHSREV